MTATRKVSAPAGTHDIGAPGRPAAKGAGTKPASGKDGPVKRPLAASPEKPAAAVARAAAPAPAPEPKTPAAPDAAEVRRFSRARTARSAEILEDYTELIADLLNAHGEARVTDIARRLGVTHPTATKALARLKREGLVTSRPYRGVFLTEAGAQMAERVRARHRLVVDFLIAVGVPREAAETDAEGMEHYVSDRTLSAFRRFLKAKA